MSQAKSARGRKQERTHLTIDTSHGCSSLDTFVIRYDCVDCEFIARKSDLKFIILQSSRNNIACRQKYGTIVKHTPSICGLNSNVRVKELRLVSDEGPRPSRLANYDLTLP